MNKQLWLMLALFLGLLVHRGWCGTSQSATLVVEDRLEQPAAHGLARLEASLIAKGLDVGRSQRVPADEDGFLVLASLSAGSGLAASLLHVMNVALPSGPESLVIRRTVIEGRPAVVLCGSDARGLMYAALDTAERIGWSDDPGNPFEHVKDTAEAPFIKERAVSIYTMQRAWFESRLHDKRHWEEYFDLLARSRINSFVVVFGYENGGFMAPPYPFFFNTPGFPEVELVGLAPDQQALNTAAFRRMIDLAHARGIDFVPAIWDHIYRGGVQGGGIAGASELAGQRVPGLVAGVRSQNLVAYNQAALEQFLDVFPEIDGLQFRMHGESGLKRQEMQGFWHEIFRMAKERRPHLRIDLRAKELPDAIIQDGLDQGLRLRVATKYWMEQMGLPFHPTQVNPPNQHDRRHGYADLLRYPQTYKVHWRLWNGGTTRLLLWGDPDYVRRFALSARLYDGESFEVNEMLATWMLGEPHDQQPWDILNPRYRHYEYPFQRYWHFYEVWGRVGYNPETPTELWERQFQQRFGAQAGPPLMRALHLASQVLPRIVAASYPYRYFPTTRGWAEMMSISRLPVYAEAEGSDVQQFLNMRDQARSLLEGTDSARRRPQDTSRWFAQISGRILDQVTQAERATGKPASNEFLATVADLKILAALASYHSHRLPAGVAYQLHKLTGDLFALDDAVQLEQQAVEAWQELVSAAGDLYTSNLAFGVHRVGFSRHWREELDSLRAGLEALLQEQRSAQPPRAGAVPVIAHVPVRRIDPGSPLCLRATIAISQGAPQVKAWTATEDGEFRATPMQPTGPGRYQVELRHAPGTRRMRYYLEASDQNGQRVLEPARGDTGPIDVTVTADDQPPDARLERASSAKPGRDLTLHAQVSDPAGVKWVRLRYRHLTQFEDYQTLDMTKSRGTGLYEAVIPGRFIVPQWDLIYFLETVDAVGNGRIYPDLDLEAPYVVVPVRP